MSKLNEKKAGSAVKGAPKKGDVEVAASKPTAVKPSTAGVQKKTATKKKKHIADEVSTLPSKRVWPD